MGTIGSYLDDAIRPVTGNPELDSVVELEAAARVLDLEDWILERLRQPESESRHNLLLIRDSGEPNTVPVLGVTHTTLADGVGGTLSFSANAFPEQLRCAAMHSSWQSAIFGIARGGAAFALRCDPQALSERELRRLTREVCELDFPGSPVLVGGAGANPTLLGWVSKSTSLRVTGKPESLGGFDHDELAATVLLELVERALQKAQRSLSGLRIAVQGVERLCFPFIDHAHKLGAHIVGVADVSGALLDPLGMSPGAIREHLDQHGVLLGYPNAEAARNEDVLKCECDVLVLAQREDQVTMANCDQIKAHIVAEVEPGAITREAMARLHARNFFVIPALVGSGGYALASHIELTEASSLRRSWLRRKTLARRVARAVDRNIREAAHKWDLGYAQAAILVGVDRVASALRASNHL